MPLINLATLPTLPDLSQVSSAATSALNLPAEANARVIAGPLGGLADILGPIFSKYFGDKSPIAATRLAAFIVGIICIAVGLMLFKPVKETVVNVAKKSAEAAAVSS